MPEKLHLIRPNKHQIAHKLLLSLKFLSNNESNEAWIDEAQRRADRIDQGEIELISAQDVSIKARALLS